MTRSPGLPWNLKQGRCHKETQLQPTSQAVTRFLVSLPLTQDLNFYPLSKGWKLKRLHGSVNIWLKMIEPKCTSDSIVWRSPRPTKVMKVVTGRTLSSLKLLQLHLTSLRVTRPLRPPLPLLCIHKGSESYTCKARDETISAASLNCG